MAETVVELNRTKMPCIKRKHLAGGEFFRIEKTEPMFVMPARSSKENLAPQAVDNFTQQMLSKTRLLVKSSQ